jgi:hypothetical protein
MALLHYKWSRTAASNATADSSVNWAEGQAPSSVNDSARALMASAAGFRDDIAGAIERARHRLYPAHHQRRDRHPQC